MKEKKKSMWPVIILVLVGIIFMVVVASKRSHATSDSTTAQDTEPQTRSLFATEEWSETKTFNPLVPTKVAWGIWSKYGSIEVRINGGPSEGGIEYVIPPRDEWTQRNWVAPDFDKQVISLQFRNLNGGEEKVWYWWDVQ